MIGADGLTLQDAYQAKADVAGLTLELIYNAGMPYFAPAREDDGSSIVYVFFRR